jgi:TPR repeat protein
MLDTDESAVFARYKLAADNGNTTGQAGLGVLYSRGLGVAVDDSQAFRWRSLAVEQVQTIEARAHEWMAVHPN